MERAAAPELACDVMLGSLARWLRAAGYDASWQADIDDWDLIRLARREGRILLSCDTGIFRIGIVRDGELPALQVPNGLTTEEQLAFVLRRLGLPLREPRCMACGGALAPATRQEAAGSVPARSLAWHDRFFRCTRCGRFFWQGRHWPSIAARLRQAAAPEAAGPVAGAESRAGEERPG